MDWPIPVVNERSRPKMIKLTSRLIGRILTLGIACIALPHASQAASETPRTMIVFDGSGSMWGKIDGSRDPKFIVLRDALRATLPASGRKASLGLTLFGHRRRGDCSDAVVQADIGERTGEELLTPIETLNPKGRGPLTLALNEAAAAIKGDTRGRSIILFHDDTDNCGQDPCGAAQAIAKADPNLRIHVLTIAGRTNEREMAQCIAKSSGGIALSAETADDVTRMTARLVTASLRGSPGVADTPNARDERLSSTGAGRTPDETGPSRLALSLTLGPRGARINHPIEWNVKRVNEGNTEVVYEGRSAMPVVSLPAGRYLASARLGIVEAQRAIDVLPRGRTDADLVLNAGTIKLTARLSAESEPIADAVFVIEPQAGAPAPTTTADPTSRFPLVATSRDGEFALPAGTYTVRSGLDTIRPSSRTITIPVGTRGAMDLNLNIGRLSVSIATTRATVGQPIQDSKAPLVRILEDDPTAPEGRREVARTTDGNPTFWLPAGSYYVVDREHAQVTDMLLATVYPGQTTEVKLSPAVGELRLSLASLEALGIEPAETTILVGRRSQAHSGAARYSARQRTVNLRPGPYFVELRHRNQRLGEPKQVDIVAGGIATLDFGDGMGAIRIAPPGSPARPEDGRLIIVTNPSGERIIGPIWHAGPLLLPAGSYRVSLDAQTTAKTLTVRAGSVLELN